MCTSSGGSEHTHIQSHTHTLKHVRHLNTCMCTCTRMHTFIRRQIDIHTCMHVGTYAYTHNCLSYRSCLGVVCVCVCMLAYTWPKSDVVDVCAHVYGILHHANGWICVHIHVHAYTHTHTRMHRCTQVVYPRMLAVMRQLGCLRACVAYRHSHTWLRWICDASRRDHEAASEASARAALRARVTQAPHAALTLSVPAQVSQWQSDHDAAAGRVRGPHVASVSVSGGSFGVAAERYMCVCKEGVSVA